MFSLLSYSGFMTLVSDPSSVGNKGRRDGDKQGFIWQHCSNQAVSARPVWAAWMSEGTPP